MSSAVKIRLANYLTFQINQLFRLLEFFPVVLTLNLKTIACRNGTQIAELWYFNNRNRVKWQYHLVFDAVLLSRKVKE